jgi:predicted phosphodiesterase
MGDHGEFIVPDDPRWNLNLVADWVDKADIASSQVEKIASYLRPIKDKILCLLKGNHEYKYIIKRHDNVHKWLCDKLELPDGGFSCFLRLVFERENSAERSAFLGCLTHGGSCATTAQGKRTALQKWMRQNMADFYAYGHIHTVDFYDMSRLTMSQNSAIVNREIMGVLSGCFLRTYVKGVESTYGEMRTYEPTVMGYSVIELDIQERSTTFKKKVYTRDN